MTEVPSPPPSVSSTLSSAASTNAPAKAEPKPSAKPAGQAATASVLPNPVAPVAPRQRDSFARGVSMIALLLSVAAVAISSASFTPQPAAIAEIGVHAELQALRQNLSVLAQNVAQLKTASVSENTPTPIVAAMPTSATAVSPSVEATTVTSPLQEIQKLQEAQQLQETQKLQEIMTEIAALREKTTGLQQGMVGADEIKSQILQLKNDLAVANTAISGMRGHVQHMADSAQQVAAAETSTRSQIIAYLELRSAAATAAPFQQALQSLCDLTKSNALIATECVKLDNSSHAGVATLPMLQSRFSVMSAPAERAVAMADAKDWMDRLKVSFDEVVRIRKIDDTGATETPKLMHEAIAALQRGNVAGAVTKVEAMPELAQKELQEWLNDARARVALDAAIIRLGTALGQSASTGSAMPDSIAPTGEVVAIPSAPTGEVVRP